MCVLKLLLTSFFRFYLIRTGGIIAFYDLLDPNIEVTSDASGILDVLDEEGNAVPGLFMIPSMDVS